MNKKKINKLLKEQEVSASILDSETNDDVFEVSVEETDEDDSAYVSTEQTDDETDIEVSLDKDDEEINQSIEVIEGIDEEGNIENPVEVNLKPGDEVSIVGDEGLEEKEVVVDNNTGDLKAVDSNEEEIIEDEDEDGLTDDDLEIIQIIDDMESKYFDKDDTIDENMYSDFSQTNNYNYEEEECDKDKIIDENMYSDFSQTNNYNYESEEEDDDLEEFLEIIEMGEDEGDEIPVIEDEIISPEDEEDVIGEEIEIIEDEDEEIIEEDLNITYKDTGDDEDDEESEEKSPEELEAAGFGDLVPEEENEEEEDLDQPSDDLEMEDGSETEEDLDQSDEKVSEEPEGTEIPEDDVNDLVADLLDGDEELEYISSLNSKDINIESVKTESTNKEELKLLKENIKQLELDKHVLLKVNGILNLMPEINNETKNRLAESFEKCKTKRQVDGLYTKIVTTFKESKRPSLNSLIIEENKGYSSFAPAEEDSSILTENTGRTVLTEEQKRKNMLMGLGNEEEYYK